MKKVFISTSTFAEFSDHPLQLLRQNGFDVVANPFRKKLNKSQCLELYPGFDAIIAGTELFDKEVLDCASRLKVIARVGVGLDSIDLDYSGKKQIKVLASSTSPALSVAELTVGLTLDLLRMVTEQANDMKSGLWEKRMGRLLSGKTLGIIGLGSIGKSVVELTKGFALNYLAFDKQQDMSFAAIHNIRYTGLDELLEQSDIVTIHLNLTAQTKNLITLTNLKQMKSGSLLINTSRGGIINEADLMVALRDQIIEAAALDVYEQEPYSGPLVQVKNVLLTPHVGSYAREIRVAMETEAAEHIIRTLQTGDE